MRGALGKLPTIHYIEIHGALRELPITIHYIEMHGALGELPTIHYI